MTIRLPARTDDLPTSLIDIAEVLGMRVAIALIENFGGLDVKFPVKPGNEHPVIKALGETDGYALCHYMGGQAIYIPRKAVANLRASVEALDAMSLSRAEIARRLQISERHVRRIANDQKDERQGNLFD